MSGGGKWKKLLKHLESVAPVLAGAAGTAAGGPVIGAALASLAKMITGKGGDADLEDVAEAILGSPELTVRMEELAIEREKMLIDLQKARLEAQTKRQEIVNMTMQAEARAEDPYVRRWRPTFGYVAAGAFGLQALGVTYILITGGQPDLINAVGDLTMVWAPAMGVLGVTSWTRGQEKVRRAEKKRDT